MTRMSQTLAIFLLGCIAASHSAEETGTAERPNDDHPKELKRTQSQDLNKFFQASHQPLSFSYFDRPASANTREIPQSNKPKSLSFSDLPTTVSANELARSVSSSQPENQSPFKMMGGTTMDTIMQAIRDLKLTIAEMDEKLDRVVQKVAPEGKVSLMRQGADMMKKIFHLPPSKDPLKSADERGFSISDNGGLHRGIGLSGRW